MASIFSIFWKKGNGEERKTTAEEMREGFLEETSEPKPEGKWREGTVNK